MKNTPTLHIATRESRLALWQAQHVQALLRAEGAKVELLGMTTRGDQILDRALSKVGGKGLFVKELETALAEGRAQLAVHSLKDVPMTLPDGFALAAVLEREDPRDAFVSPRFESLAALPPGACVGTSSLRRMVQLAALRPDLVFEPLRGNLDTRLRKLDEGQFDAIVLAAAGLKRLGLGERIRAYFSVQDMIPAAGQGALAIEVLPDGSAWQKRLRRMTDTPTWLAVHAERAVSRALGGSCSVPLAAHAQWRSAESADAPHGGELELSVALGDAVVHSRRLLTARVFGRPTDVAGAEAMGNEAAAMLQVEGAAAYLSDSA